MFEASYHYKGRTMTVRTTMTDKADLALTDLSLATLLLRDLNDSSGRAYNGLDIRFNVHSACIYFHQSINCPLVVADCCFFSEEFGLLLQWVWRTSGCNRRTCVMRLILSFQPDGWPCC